MNYPGTVELVESDAQHRNVFGQHDPLGILRGACVCAVPFDPDGDGIDQFECFDLDVNRDHRIDIADRAAE